MKVPPRFTHRALPILIALLISTLATGILAAQNPSAENPTGWSQQEAQRIVREVQKKLGGLAYYSVFDWITFDLRDKSVILHGYAGLPTLKSSAGNAVKGIHGVESVQNDIEVLPTSMIDDHIRVQVYNRIYTQPALRKYNAYQGGVRQATQPQPSVARMAGGILYDPPIGFNAIHIIVKNSRVMLFGVVDSQSDKSIAGLQAQTVPGVFNVQNDLIVAQNPPKSQKKK
ncbi:MAG TPA: BON domain-containing protein [Acidobacteriaceae bacterium]|nr:BON domain-containing protein [Acidobacteriaceae bacterium]